VSIWARKDLRLGWPGLVLLSSQLVRVLLLHSSTDQCTRLHELASNCVHALHATPGAPPTGHSLPRRYSKALVDPSLHSLGDELLAKFEDTERALLTVSGVVGDARRLAGFWLLVRGQDLAARMTLG